MRTIGTLLIGHAALLLLASTNFMIVSWLWGNTSWTWNYFQYSYGSGWGYDFQSNYPLGQVLCYLGAYGLGLAAYGLVWIRLRLRVCNKINVSIF